MDEARIYVAVAGTVQVPADRPRRTVIQPAGRQIAQACHVVSALRHRMLKLSTETSKMTTAELVSVARERADFEPATTIILQARDSSELRHIQTLLFKKKLQPVSFFDTNSEAYGPSESVMTAVAVLATKKQIENIIDYLPLWGAQ